MKIVKTLAAGEMIERPGERTTRVLKAESIEKAKRRKSKSPLIGLFFHTYRTDGALAYQGQVFAVDDDVVLARVYDWITGLNATVKTFDKEFIYSEFCRLYETQEEWRRAANDYHRRLELDESLS